MFAQFGDICKRSAAKEDLRVYIRAACQRADHLHRYRIEHRSGYILFAHRTGDQILYIRLAEYTATRRYRVDMFGTCSQIVQFGYIHAEQSSRLVDECARSAGTVTVHTHIRHAT